MNKPGPSRKRKRGKKKNLLIEDDDDAVDVVTFEEVTVNTSRGPVKKIMEVPLRPVPDSNVGRSSRLDRFPSSRIDDFVGGRLYLDDEEPTQELSKNKVVLVHGLFKVG
jgi:hypothetical protein